MLHRVDAATPRHAASGRFRPAVAWVAVAVALAAWAAFATRRPQALVVYCAHDIGLAEPILDAFAARTGIELQVVYDTEATKTLGLVERVVAEQGAPRADVLWCNEPLGVMRLHELGLLQPYRGAGFARIPDAWKEAGAHWVGFAARLRVWITPADRPARTAAELDSWLTAQLEAGDLARFAIAVPLYGTTRFHVTALWALRGDAWLRAWLRDLRLRGARFVRGNAAVKDLVAAGAADAGWTDTDDAAAAGTAAHATPVEVDGFTLCIPNTVAIVRGARHEAAARALVDHLLSSETELSLARGRGQQIPLGQVDDADMPEPVQRLRAAAKRALPLERVRGAHARVLAWLREEWLDR
ncbi:MAG: substrate-binding domain-containing protein [Planctomycetota bacterium]